MVRTAEPLQILGQSLTLDSAPAVFWHERNVLFVSDLHLGKESTFQRAAIAVPVGSTEATLDALSNAIERFQPTEVVILGDFIHAPCSLSEHTREVIERFWAEHRDCSFRLIEGNHDRGSRAAIAAWPLEVVKPPYFYDPFWLLHDAASEWKFVSDSIDNARQFGLSGHVHPAVRLEAIGSRLPCFVIGSQHMILPAFGRMTGTKVVSRKPGERIFLVTEESVYEWKNQPRVRG